MCKEQKGVSGLLVLHQALSKRPKCINSFSPHRKCKK